MFKWGGTLTETVLWTNPSPTANFSAQATIPYTDTDGYDYIKVTYKVAKTTTDVYSVIFPKVDFDLFADSNGRPLGTISAKALSGSYRYARRIFKDSNSKIYFHDATVVGASGTDNSAVIPYQIIGIK